MLFKTRRDLPMNAITVAIIVFLFSVLYLSIRFVDFTPLILFLFLIYLFSIWLALYSIFQIRYWIREEGLFVQMGPFQSTYHYSDMKRIDYTKGLSRLRPVNVHSFMWAVDGIELHFKGEVTKIQLSPERQGEFIQELFKRAPQLAYCSIEEQRAKHKRQEQVEQQEVVMMPHIGGTVKGSKVGSSSSEWLKM
ncbi:PH domain-containing protein [Alkalihalophilus lindianensis]|uniref:PH domain-containing protein n=1 Tax=Alkalihalophilus lindianensis TaxID=1630542 RepID=A0ABU3X502_9BACI|nr:PH domain-containing protein [Alkalihalophilus lindianensis]MDV2682976.1 PH domain-containing protein [Alkalihalophilus lindianensis]